MNYWGYRSLITVAILLIYWQNTIAQNATLVDVAVDGNEAEISISFSNAAISLSAAFKQIANLGITNVKLKIGNYSINAPIELYNGAIVYGEDKNLVTIEQCAMGYPAFDIPLGLNIEISDLKLIYKKSRSIKKTKSFRGANPELYIAGIYYNGSSGSFKRLIIEGFTTGIMLASWDGPNIRSLRTSNQIHDVEVSNVDFGVLAAAQQGLSIRELKGSYGLHKGAKAPPHLIYISGNSETPKTQEFVISDCHAMDSRDGHAYKVENVKNGVIRNMTATNCRGVLLLESGTNITIDSIVGIRDVTPGNGSVVFGKGNCRKITLSNVTIQTTGLSGKILRIDGDSNRLMNITINEILKEGAGSMRFLFGGSNSSVDNFKYVNANPNKGAIGMRMMGDNLRATNIECRNCDVGVILAESCEQCLLEIDPIKVTSNSSDSISNPYRNNSATSQVRTLESSRN